MQAVAGDSLQPGQVMSQRLEQVRGGGEGGAMQAVAGEGRGHAQAVANYSLQPGQVMSRRLWGGYSHAGCSNTLLYVYGIYLFDWLWQCSTHNTTP